MYLHFSLQTTGASVSITLAEQPVLVFEPFDAVVRHVVDDVVF